MNAPESSGSVADAMLPRASASGCSTGCRAAKAPEARSAMVVRSGSDACQSASMADPAPSMADAAIPHTAEPSGSRAAATRFCMSCHVSGQSAVASMVPMMSPWAPSADCPSSSRLTAPLLSAATNCGALRVPNMSLAALMADASSPAAM